MTVIPLANLLGSLEDLATELADAIAVSPRCVCPEPSLINVIDEIVWGCVICNGLIVHDNPLEGFAP